MKLTDTQKKILEDITNKFNALNEKESVSNTFSLIDMSDVISTVKARELQYEEIQLNNEAMNQVGLNLIKDIVKKLDDDFRKAKVNLKCLYDKDRTRANQIPIEIIPFNPYTGDFIDVNDDIKLTFNLEFKYERFYFYSHGWTHKIVGFKFCNSTIERQTIEELVTSGYFRERIEKLYTKYCNI